MACRQDAQDNMLEDTETKQGSTVEKASQLSQAVNVSSCKRFRSHDEPLMISASCCSSAHVEFLKVRCTPL